MDLADFDQPTLPTLPPWPLPLPPQLPALREAAAQAGASTFFSLWDNLAQAQGSLLLSDTSSEDPQPPTTFSVVTVTDDVWSSFLPDPPIPPALIRQCVGAGLAAAPLSLVKPSTIRTVGGGTLVIEPGEGRDPLTVNDQASCTTSFLTCTLYTMSSTVIWRTNWEFNSYFTIAA